MSKNKKHYSPKSNFPNKTTSTVPTTTKKKNTRKTISFWLVIAFLVICGIGSVLGSYSFIENRVNADTNNSGWSTNQFYAPISPNWFSQDFVTGVGQFTSANITDSFGYGYFIFGGLSFNAVNRQLDIYDSYFAPISSCYVNIDSQWFIDQPDIYDYNRALFYHRFVKAIVLDDPTTQYDITPDLPSFSVDSVESANILNTYFDVNNADSVGLCFTMIQPILAYNTEFPDFRDNFNYDPYMKSITSYLVLESTGAIGDTLSSVNFTYGTGVRNLSFNKVIYTFTNGTTLTLNFMISDSAYRYNDDLIFSNRYYNLGNSASADYDAGYTAGLNASQESIYNDGYNRGITIGEQTGYARGWYDGLEQTSNFNFYSLMSAVVDAPVQAVSGLLNFDIFGFNMKAVFFSFLTIALVIFVVRKLT